MLQKYSCFTLSFLWICAFPALIFSQEQVLTPTNIEISALLDSLRQDPIAFERSGNMDTLIHRFEEVSYIDLSRTLKKIFEETDGLIENFSEANKGIIGKLNRRSNKRRKKFFDREIKKGFRDYEKHPQHKVILAEGDSWFQFPIIIKDIVDHLMKRKDYAVRSLAYGGEWLSNILQQNNYLRYYLELKPDAMLMSGGGNDMVGERLSSMVDLPKNNQLSQKYMDKYKKYIITRLTDLSNSPPCNDGCEIPDNILAEYNNSIDTLKYNKALVEKILHGRKFINDRFYVLLTLHKLQYYLFLESLKKADPKYFKEQLTIVTQGYDYPIPSSKKGKHFKQIFLNTLAGNGQNLKYPLMTKGIIKPEDQEAVMTAIIFEFDEMLTDVVTNHRYEDTRLFLIDCRGGIEYMKRMKKRKFYWNDELHPSSAAFGEIAKAYQQCIDGEQPSRIVKLTSLMEDTTE